MQDFHLHYRYSYRHSRLHALHRSLRYGFNARATLSYRTFVPVASVSILFPIIYGASLLDQ